MLHFTMQKISKKITFSFIVVKWGWIEYPSPPPLNLSNVRLGKVNLLLLLLYIYCGLVSVPRTKFNNYTFDTLAIYNLHTSNHPTHPLIYYSGVYTVIYFPVSLLFPSLPSFLFLFLLFLFSPTFHLLSSTFLKVML